MTDKNKDDFDISKELADFTAPRTHPAAAGIPATAPTSPFASRVPSSAPSRAGVGQGTPRQPPQAAVPLDPRLADHYSTLERILRLALEQAAVGKGAERHAVGFAGPMPWDDQPILVNARQVGPGGPAQQVMKKAGESVMMSVMHNFSGAKAEALGAMVYAAALFKLYEEMEAAATVTR